MLNTFSLILLLATGGVSLTGEPAEFGNPFGMQLRKPPGAAREVFAPVIVQAAPTNECSLIARRDGVLEIYHATKPSSDSVSVMRSTDGGLTWSEPEVAFPIPGKIYYAVLALEAKDGRTHAIFHIAEQGLGGYRGRLYNVWHTRTTADGKGWEEPKLVVPGYVGSIRGFIELASGRLVLAVGRANPERETPPAEGTDYGWNDVAIFTSNDGGTNWSESPDILKVPLPDKNNTRYGAIEPALVQLADGRVWMLIRNRDGRFWESFSNDGSRWSEPARTEIITSDSPAGFVRLKDGGLVLLANACQNWSDPRSYAMGGREALQASISRDEGKTWAGFRDVLHEAVNPLKKGDRGSAYATAAETPEGKICMVSGQGEGNRAIVLFDPKWLEETTVADDLAAGPVLWTQYGAEGLRVEGREVVIPLEGGALWNFPAARSGRISLRLRLPKTARDLSLSLADHFARLDDKAAAANAAVAFSLDGLPREKWLNVSVKWTQERATLEVDGRQVAALAARAPVPRGLFSLRLEGKDSGEIKATDLSFLKP